MQEKHSLLIRIGGFEQEFLDCPLSHMLSPNTFLSAGATSHLAGNSWTTSALQTFFSTAHCYYLQFYPLSFSKIVPTWEMSFPLLLSLFLLTSSILPKLYQTI